MADCRNGISGDSGSGLNRDHSDRDDHSPPSSDNSDVEHISKQSLVSLLDCPVCFETCCPPIFACVIGHKICKQCLPLVQNCPVCRSRFGGTRDMVGEELFAHLKLKESPTLIDRPPMARLIRPEASPSDTSEWETMSMVFDVDFATDASISFRIESSTDDSSSNSSTESQESTNPLAPTSLAAARSTINSGQRQTFREIVNEIHDNLAELVRPQVLLVRNSHSTNSRSGNEQNIESRTSRRTETSTGYSNPSRSNSENRYGRPRSGSSSRNLAHAFGSAINSNSRSNNTTGSRNRFWNNHDRSSWYSEDEPIRPRNTNLHSLPATGLNSSASVSRGNTNTTSNNNSRREGGIWGELIDNTHSDTLLNHIIGQGESENSVLDLTGTLNGFNRFNSTSYETPSINVGSSTGPSREIQSSSTYLPNLVSTGCRSEPNASRPTSVISDIRMQTMQRTSEFERIQHRIGTSDQQRQFQRIWLNRLGAPDFVPANRDPLGLRRISNMSNGPRSSNIPAPGPPGFDSSASEINYERGRSSSSELINPNFPNSFGRRIPPGFSSPMIEQNTGDLNTYINLGLYPNHQYSNIYCYGPVSPVPVIQYSVADCIYFQPQFVPYLPVDSNYPQQNFPVLGQGQNQNSSGTNPSANYFQHGWLPFQPRRWCPCLPTQGNALNGDGFNTPYPNNFVSLPGSYNNNGHQLSSQGGQFGPVGSHIRRRPEVQFAPRAPFASGILPPPN